MKAASGSRSPSDVTPEVADEGGTPGDVEIETEVTGTGSEGGETWVPAEERRRQIIRDEKGEGRRTP